MYKVGLQKDHRNVLLMVQTMESLLVILFAYHLEFGGYIFFYVLSFAIRSEGPLYRRKVLCLSVCLSVYLFDCPRLQISPVHISLPWVAISFDFDNHF